MLRISSERAFKGESKVLLLHRLWTVFVSFPMIELVMRATIRSSHFYFRTFNDFVAVVLLAYATGFDGGHHCLAGFVPVLQEREVVLEFNIFSTVLFSFRILFIT